MTERSLYPDNVEVRQRDLENTETTKARQILLNRIDVFSEAVADGLAVSVNVGTNTLIDVASGRAYTPSGEVCELASAVVGNQLSDYTASTVNSVCLAYTELEQTPAPHISDGTTRNTQVVGVTTVRVYTAAELAALPATLADVTQVARDRVVVIATVVANGTGVALTPASITAVLPAKTLLDKLNRDGTNSITGVILPDVDVTRDFGSAAFSYQTLFAERLTLKGAAAISAFSAPSAVFGPSGSASTAPVVINNDSLNASALSINHQAGSGFRAIDVLSAGQSGIEVSHSGVGNALNISAQNISTTFSAARMVSTSPSATAYAIEGRSANVGPTAMFLNTNTLAESAALRLQSLAAQLQLVGNVSNGLTGVEFNTTDSAANRSRVFNTPNGNTAGTAARLDIDVGGGTGEVDINAFQTNVGPTTVSGLLRATAFTYASPVTYRRWITPARSNSGDYPTGVGQTIGSRFPEVFFLNGGVDRVYVVPLDNVFPVGAEITQITVYLSPGGLLTAPQLRLLYFSNVTPGSPAAETVITTVTNTNTLTSTHIAGDNVYGLEVTKTASGSDMFLGPIEVRWTTSVILL